MGCIPDTIKQFLAHLIWIISDVLLLSKVRFSGKFGRPICEAEVGGRILTLWLAQRASLPPNSASHLKWEAKSGRPICEAEWEAEFWLSDWLREHLGLPIRPPTSAYHFWPSTFPSASHFPLGLPHFLMWSVWANQRVRIWPHRSVRPWESDHPVCVRGRSESPKWEAVWEANRPLTHTGRCCPILG